MNKGKLTIKSITVGIICVISSIVSASNVVVTTINDSGEGSLRNSVASANAGDSILFSDMINSFSINLLSPIILDKQLFIVGNGYEVTIISGGSTTRIFEITQGAQVEIKYLSVIDGNASVPGGGALLIDEGSAILSSVRLSGNQAADAGGAIYVGPSDTLYIYNSKINYNSANKVGGAISQQSESFVQIERSEISNNFLTKGGAGLNSYSAGGGLYNTGGILIITSSTIAHNSALGLNEARGGGIHGVNNSTISVDRSTISGNTSGVVGGGIYNSKEMEIFRSTIMYNQSADGGGYAQQEPAANLDISGTVIANNIGPVANPDILVSDGMKNSGGYNFIGKDPARQFLQRATDLEGLPSEWHPLANNGGYTLSHLPVAGNPIIDQGDPNDDSRDQINKPIYGGRREIGSLELSPPIFYADFDGDGYGDPDVFAYGEVPPDNYVADGYDNCPNDYNPNQNDGDRDGVGDVCEGDYVEEDEFFLAADCATVGDKFTIRVDTAGGGEIYARYNGPVSTGNPPPDLPENRVRFIIPNAIAGSYTLFARVRAPTATSDSYWVRINNGAWVNWNQGLRSSVFAWNEVSGSPFNLISGENSIDFAYREPNTDLEKIYLSIGGTLPTDGPGGSAYSCTPDVPLQEVFWLEAECAEVGNNFSTVLDNAASNQQFSVYIGQNSMSTPPADVPENRIRFTLDNALPGFYNLFARVRSPNGGDSDSYWIRVNQGAWQRWFQGVASSTFAWKEVVGNSYELRQGYNTVDIAYREANAQIDKVYIAIGGLMPASGMGSPATNCN
ncbi:choice-of-anchor Q domain-containing protein [Lewinella sp. IMCC34191]|uniref:choice-of-anchor Q domain-containing protein n=1 Tax=Lewinella sp. IMCC34191 TaxID=2259172 RepID=UPI001300B91B|nr:choice-of-anchor Q domain-containing protein [Lewinella sp. IMCC34191]